MSRFWERMAPSKSPPMQKEPCYVVWSEGKPITLVRNHHRSQSSKKVTPTGSNNNNNSSANHLVRSNSTGHMTGSKYVPKLPKLEQPYTAPPQEVPPGAGAVPGGGSDGSKPGTAGDTSGAGQPLTTYTYRTADSQEAGQSPCVLEQLGRPGYVPMASTVDESGLPSQTRGGPCAVDDMTGVDPTPKVRGHMKVTGNPVDLNPGPVLAGVDPGPCSGSVPGAAVVPERPSSCDVINRSNVVVSVGRSGKLQPRTKATRKKSQRLEKEYSTLKTKEQEEQVELRRLRTENRLLRQRIDNLEKETATLADRLIQDQVKHAHKVEEVFVLRRDLCTIRDHDSDTSQKLDDVTEELRKQQSLPDSVISETSLDSEHDEKVQRLEKEVSEMKNTEQELNATMVQLRNKIRELENSNQQLQCEPSVEIQTLQEELIACKLREAEASLSMKEMQQRVFEMEKAWQRHMEKYNVAGQSPSNNKDKMKKDAEMLANELMTIRIREGRAISELKEHKQRVMELETQNQIHSRQIKRIDDEKEKLQEQIEEDGAVIKELNNNVKDKDRLLSNLESNRKEDLMMAKIKDAEHSQSIAEMRQKIAQLEIEKEELLASGQLDEQDNTMELEDKVADLQAEVLRLKMGGRLPSISSLSLNPYSADDLSDYDTDDMDNAILSKNSFLNLQTSDIASEPLAGDGEGLYDFDDATIKRRSNSHKTKRRKSETECSEAELLPTPTNEWCVNEQLQTECDNKSETNDKQSATELCCVKTTEKTTEKTTDCDINKATVTQDDCADTPKLNGDVFSPETEDISLTPGGVRDSGDGAEEETVMLT